ncbi:MAG: hypothetical protein K6F42_03255 [Bacteroidales bacterium]|nr:hypothetical protein [Bacteroidales bacterium]
MKLSQDQKRMLRASALYPPCYAAVLILYNLLFKKEMAWGDVLALFLGSLLLSAIFAIFTIFGARIPTRDTPDTPGKANAAPDTPAPDVNSSAPPVIPSAAQRSRGISAPTPPDAAPSRTQDN